MHLVLTGAHRSARAVLCGSQRAAVRRVHRRQPLACYSVPVGRTGRRLGLSQARQNAFELARLEETVGWAELIIDWLDVLPKVKRQVTERYTEGTSIRDSAVLFGVTAGRISQVRKELAKCWSAFMATPLAA